MPITRRRRATSPEQPENNHNHTPEQVELANPDAPDAGQNGGSSSADASSPNTQASPRGEHVPERYTPYVPSSSSVPGEEHTENGERTPRLQRGERTDYTPASEGGRRTARGEFFRRPPQPPAAQPMPSVVPSMPLQAPSHEINLPLGNLLHLAYNPSYTGSEEARSALLQKLADESKSGGRARCWNCGSLAIVYDRWSTRSKNFGEVGIAFCEICGVWSVL
jgi:hypothetical protein